MGTALDNFPIELLRERLAYDPETGILTWTNGGGNRGLGLFADKEEAHETYLAARRALYTFQPELPS